VTIRVVYSSINYKDALAASGHPGVVRKFPHVPGIDAAGIVVESDSDQFTVGDSVVVTSYELGVERWGGWSEFIRVQPEWIVPLPEGLTLKESMILGTAGLTAAMCVNSLIHHHITVGSGNILVTGASGGVGSFAVSLLSRLAFQVTAVSGKHEMHERLRKLGASKVIDRLAIDLTSDKPLLKGHWPGRHRYRRRFSIKSPRALDSTSWLCRRLWKCRRCRTQPHRVPLHFKGRHPRWNRLRLVSHRKTNGALAEAGHRMETARPRVPRESDHSRSGSRDCRKYPRRHTPGTHYHQNRRRIEAPLMQKKRGHTLLQGLSFLIQ